MIDIQTITTDKPQDFQQVRVETVALVTAASNATSGLGETQAGVYVILPASQLLEHNRTFSRIFLISPVELVRNTLDEHAVFQRIREVIASTPIRYDAKRQQQTVLNVDSPHFEAMARRLTSTISVAGNNFRRDVGELLSIYDGFTQPTINLPVCSAFHAQAAFANRELLNTYRGVNGLPLPASPPTVTPEIRKTLERFGVSAPAIPDRVLQPVPVPAAAQGLMHHALPAGATALQQTAQGDQYGKEVQMILHVLGNAIVAKEIQPLVMNDAFRAALAKAIDNARAATYMQSAQENLLNTPHA